jgi:hypothetical protein
MTVVKRKVSDDSESFQPFVPWDPSRQVAIRAMIAAANEFVVQSVLTVLLWMTVHEEKVALDSADGAKKMG